MQWPLHTLANSNVRYGFLPNTAFADTLNSLVRLVLLGFMVVSF